MDETTLSPLAAPADDKRATSPFAAQVWRGVHVSSRWSKADELADMRDLVDGLDAAGLARAVESVWCDSQSMVRTITLRRGARPCRRCLVAEVQAWLDRVGSLACIEGDRFSVDFMQGDCPDEEEGPCGRLAEDARTLLLGRPSAVRARMARRLVEDLEAALEAA